MIQLNQLTICINQHTICRDLSLTFKPGSICGVLGPNGSGKTTFLHSLAGLHPHTHGDILLGEQSLAQCSLRALAQLRGMLFQDFQATFSQTVWEYCLTGRFPHSPYFKTETAKDKHIVTQALELMELLPLAQRAITELSGGEKRRLAIATLLAQTPAIYLLDEPTNHLDVRHQIQVLEHFQSLAKIKSFTIIMSLHDVNLAQRFCDHVLLLFPHAETVYGSTSSLLTADNLTRLYQHPMRFLANNDTLFWYAESFCQDRQNNLHYL